MFYQITSSAFVLPITDWSGLSALLSANGGLIFFLACGTGLFAYILLVALTNMYYARQHRLQVEAEAKCEVSRNELRRQELRLEEVRLLQGASPAERE